MFPLNFNTEFFLSLDNEDKMSSKRRVVNLASLLFLLSSILLLLLSSLSLSLSLLFFVYSTKLYFNTIKHIS